MLLRRLDTKNGGGNWVFMCPTNACSITGAENTTVTETREEGENPLRKRREHPVHKGRDKNKLSPN